MKKVLLQFSILCLLMPLLAPTCRSEQFEPSKGILAEFDVTSESVNANATKASDPVFSKTYTVNLSTEFKNRIKVDPAKVTELFVKGFIVEFNTGNCAKLSAYSVIATFPLVGTETNSDCASALNYTSSASAFGARVLATNFAPAIKDDKAVISVTFTMKAKEDIPAGSGVKIKLLTTATYLP
jgi:hypothetical protein